MEVRSVEAARLLVTEMEDPARAQVLSIPDRGDPGVNQLVIRRGRYPRPGRNDEVLILDSFAREHGIGPGDALSAIMNGVERDLRVVGLAMSPEFVFPMGAGEVMPDPKRFAAVWDARNTDGGCLRPRGCLQ